MQQELQSCREELSKKEQALRSITGKVVIFVLNLFQKEFLLSAKIINFFIIVNSTWNSQINKEKDYGIETKITNIKLYIH